jgi:hypothetical protein
MPMFYLTRKSVEEKIAGEITDGIHYRNGLTAMLAINGTLTDAGARYCSG